MTLKVVLFCSGNGADFASYRPRRDDSQWWNRRDALVRCVSSFLFGPTVGSDSSSNRMPPRELVLFYDGDHCRVHMSLLDDNDISGGGDTSTLSDKARNNQGNNVVPSEHVIIALWKEAVGKALQSTAATPVIVRKGRLQCWAVLASAPPIAPPTTAATRMTGASSSQNRSNSSASFQKIQNWSKRQVLEYLQKECPIEFLREHNLNSNPAVILRKTNRAALTKVYQQWVSTSGSKAKSSTSSTTNNKVSQQQLLEDVFAEILAPNQHKNMIAGTLHESSDCELPCFGKDSLTAHAVDSDDDQGDLHLCLFLGAVRDMIPIEYKALEAVCTSSNNTNNKIPLVKVRLGSVPEFTSKILSVVAFHHAQGVLGPAIQKLVVRESDEKQQQKRKLSIEADSTASSTSSSTPQLHIIGLVPLRADQVVIDLDRRDRTLWCIVRILVCSLWRSRLASSKWGNPLDNTVTLVFLDGSHVTLQQQEWVSALAEQHQAAPSEFQVLTALIDRLKAQLPKTNHRSKSLPAWEQVVPGIMKDLTSTNHDATVMNHMISLERDATTDLAKRFYSQETFASSPSTQSSQSAQNVWVLLPIGSTSEGDGVLVQAQKSFLTMFQDDPKWSIHHQSMSASVGPTETTTRQSCCGDWEASSVVMLQHFMYQDRMFTSSESVQPTETEDNDEGVVDAKERKHEKKRKDKHKKSKKKRKHE